MRIKLIAISVFLLLSGLANAQPYRFREPPKFYVGLNIGPVVGWNKDFNGENGKSSTGFSIGAEIVNSLSCMSCKHLMLESSVGYEYLGQYTFKPVRVKGSKLTGIYKESQYILHGNFGVRYNFTKDTKITPFVSFAPGVYYIKIKSASYKDVTGGNLDFGDISRSSLNFGFGLGIGLSYKLSHKISLELYPKWHVFFPQGFGNSFIQIPLTIKYRF